MDVGVDRKAKYALMYRKTAIITENDEESTHLTEKIKISFTT